MEDMGWKVMDRFVFGFFLLLQLKLGFDCMAWVVLSKIRKKY